MHSSPSANSSLQTAQSVTVGAASISFVIVTLCRLSILVSEAGCGPYLPSACCMSWLRMSWKPVSLNAKSPIWAVPPPRPPFKTSRIVRR